MKKLKFISSVLLVLAINSTAAFAQDDFKWERFQNGCEEGTKAGKIYPLKFYSLFSGEISATKISILAKNKKVCTDPVVATGKSDDGNNTIISFEDGLLLCIQTTDKGRLDADDIRRTGYKIIGSSAGVRGRSLYLKDCSIVKM